MKLRVDQIRTDGGTQSRARLNALVVDEYAEAIRGGADFPPVRVMFDGENYWLVDGFHRVHAARQAGLTEIEADVEEGDRRAAVWASLAVNATHGLRRSNEDKRRAVFTMLEDVEWSKLSGNEIARQCSVSNMLVSRMRAEVESARRMIGGRLSPEMRAAVRESRVGDSQREIGSIEKLEDSMQKDVMDQVAGGQAGSVHELWKMTKREREAAAHAPAVKVVAGSLDQVEMWRFEDFPFRVIVADPPWQKIGARVRGRTPLTAEEIAAQPVGKLADVNCVLFLWAPRHVIPAALSVMNAWGFEYADAMPWIMTDTGGQAVYEAGHWALGVSELVLIGKRGTVSPLSSKRYLGLLGTGVTGDFKPADIYTLAESFPGPYLEVFSRIKRAGWTTSGGELKDNGQQ